MRSHLLAKEYWSDITENCISDFLCDLPDQEVLYTLFCCILHVLLVVQVLLVGEVLDGGYVITHEGFGIPSRRVAMAAFLRRGYHPFLYSQSFQSGYLSCQPD